MLVLLLLPHSQGVPCVQAVGEGEAMCAALNLCGWTHACHTLDVDALLFGALTVYRQVHLQVRKVATQQQQRQGVVLSVAMLGHCVEEFNLLLRMRLILMLLQALFTV